MKRGAIIGGSITTGLVVLAAIGPYFTGLKAEQSLREDHAIVARELLLPGLEITLADYQRGWFSAEGVTAITFTPDAHDAEPLTVELHHHISHLPAPLHGAIASATSELVLPARMQAQAGALLKGQPPLIITTYISITGSRSATFASPAFKTTLDEPSAVIDWKGLLGSATSSDNGHIKTGLTLPGLTITSPQWSATFNEVRYDSDTTRGRYDIGFGKSTASMKSVQFNYPDDAGTKTFAFSDVLIASEQMERGEVADGTVIFQIGKSTYDDFAVDSAVYDLEFRNIELKSLAEIQSVMKQPTASGDDAAAGMAVMDTIPSLLKAQPEFNIRRLQIRSSQGNFDGKLRLAFVGAWKDEMLDNPLAVLAMLNADFEFVITKSLFVSLGQAQMRDSIAAMAEVHGDEFSAEEIEAMAKERAAQQLEMLAANEYLQEKDDHYMANIHFEKGQLTINGKTAGNFFGAPAK